MGNRHKSPLNMQLLAAFTVAESIAVATAISMVNGVIVLQAAVLCAAVVTGLVLFTFQTKRDFTPMNSILVTALWVMIGISFVQVRRRSCSSCSQQIDCATHTHTHTHTHTIRRPSTPHLPTNSPPPTNQYSVTDHDPVWVADSVVAVGGGCIGIFSVHRC